MALARRDLAKPAHPWGTLALCVAMLAVHILGHDEAPLAGIPGRLALLAQGAKSVALIADVDEGWRSLSAHFVHTSWTHLIFNLAFFVPVAGALEAVMRRLDYLLLLAVVATTSGLFSVAWTPEISAGASGLVYGTLGAAVMVGIHHAHRMARPLRIYFGLWVLPFLAVILFLGANNPQLDHFSHLGGLIGGVVVAPFLRLRTQPALRWEAKIKGTLATATLGLCALFAPPLARGFGAFHTVALQGIEIEVPAGWGTEEHVEVGLCIDGKTQISGASTLVRLEFDRVNDLGKGISPDLADRMRSSGHPRALEGRPRWQEARGSGCPRQAAAIGASTCEEALDFEREGVWLRREQRWVQVDGAWLVVAFEAPLRWWSKYDETRERIFGSIRAVPCRAH